MPFRPWLPPFGGSNQQHSQRHKVNGIGPSRDAGAAICRITRDAADAVSSVLMRDTRVLLVVCALGWWAPASAAPAATTPAGKVTCAADEQPERAATAVADLRRLGLAYSFPDELGRALASRQLPGDRVGELYCGAGRSFASVPAHGACGAARVNLTHDGRMLTRKGGDASKFCLAGDDWGQVVIVRVRTTAQADHDDLCFVAQPGKAYAVPGASKATPVAAIRVWSDRAADTFTAARKKALDAAAPHLETLAREAVYRLWANRVYEQITTAGIPQNDAAQANAAVKAADKAKTEAALAQKAAAVAEETANAATATATAAQKKAEAAEARLKAEKLAKEAKAAKAEADHAPDAAELRRKANEMGPLVEQAHDESARATEAATRATEDAQVAHALATVAARVVDQRQAQLDYAKQLATDAKAQLFGPLYAALRRDVEAMLSELGPDAIELAQSPLDEALNNIDPGALNDADAKTLCRYVSPHALTTSTPAPVAKWLATAHQRHDAVGDDLREIALAHQARGAQVLPWLMFEGRFPISDRAGPIVELLPSAGEEQTTTEIWQDDRLLFFAHDLERAKVTIDPKKPDDPPKQVSPADVAVIEAGDAIQTSDLSQAITAAAIMLLNTGALGGPTNKLAGMMSFDGSEVRVSVRRRGAGARSCDDACVQSLKSAADDAVRSLARPRVEKLVFLPATEPSSAELYSDVVVKTSLDTTKFQLLRICRGAAACTGSGAGVTVAQHRLRVRANHAVWATYTELSVAATLHAIPIGGYRFERVGGAGGPDQLYQLRRNTDVSEYFSVSQLLAIYPLAIAHVHSKWCQGLSIGAGPTFVHGNSAEFLRQWNFRVAWEFPDSRVLLTFGPSLRFVDVPAFAREGTVMAVPRDSMGNSNAPSGIATDRKDVWMISFGLALDLSILSDAAKGLLDVFKGKK
jgi:hypothetical protein